jgi:shikimate kinase
MSNIVLTGMPGAGKSTAGIILAKTLGMSFIDTDIEIQEREKRLLADIIKQDGIEAFLKIEEDIALSLVYDNAVIATGGSMVYSPRAMAHFKERSTVVYLKLDYDAVEKRIRNIRTRGIAMKSGCSLRDVYIERQPLYEEYADVTIDCTGKSVEETVEAIMKAVVGSAAR